MNTRVSAAAVVFDSTADPGIRQAKDRIRIAVDLAARVGCNRVSPRLCHDGWLSLATGDAMRATRLLREALSGKEA